MGDNEDGEDTYQKVLDYAQVAGGGGGGWGSSRDSADILFPRQLFSDTTKDVVCQLLTPVASKRMTPQEARDHPFFSSIDLDDLERGKVMPPYKPTVASITDTSNFDHFEEDMEESVAQEVERNAILRVWSATDTQQSLKVRAIKFLQSEEIAHVPLYTRCDFLKSQGISSRSIDHAIDSAGLRALATELLPIPEPSEFEGFVDLNARSFTSKTPDGKPKERGKLAQSPQGLVDENDVHTQIGCDCRCTVS